MTRIIPIIKTKTLFLNSMFEISRVLINMTTFQFNFVINLEFSEMVFELSN